MLYFRYKNLDYLLSIDFEDGCELINVAIEAHNNEMITRRWLIGGYEKAMSLQEFKANIITPVAPQQSKEEILTEVRTMFMGGGEPG